MRGILALVAAVTLWAGPARANVVVFQQTGSTSTLDLWQVFPGAGKYSVAAITSEIVNFYVTGGYTYHWDVFLAPPPRPHDEFIEGNTDDVNFGDYFTSGMSTFAIFEIPETKRTFFDSDIYYTNYGIPEGTPLYLEEMSESPHFFMYANADDRRDFTYSVIVTRISAVPEPSIWAMMIVGFGLLGAGLRANRRALGRPA